MAVAREIAGQDFLIGRSVHSEGGAAQAVAQGADFLVVGTMYTTRSHPGGAPVGPGLVRRIAANCRTPLIGIGGINESNASQVLMAGASGIAVITSILASPDPKQAAQTLKRAMLDSWPAGSSSIQGEAQGGSRSR